MLLSIRSLLKQRAHDALVIGNAHLTKDSIASVSHSEIPIAVLMCRDQTSFLTISRCAPSQPPHPPDARMFQTGKAGHPVLCDKQRSSNGEERATAENSQSSQNRPKTGI